MFMSRMLEVGKAENGFVVSCTVPLKPDAKKTDRMMSCCDNACDKQYIATDAKEVGDLISDIMPLLDGDYKTEEDFDAAFDEATSAMEDSKEEKGGTTNE